MIKILRSLGLLLTVLSLVPLLILSYQQLTSQKATQTPAPTPAPIPTATSPASSPVSLGGTKRSPIVALELARSSSEVAEALRHFKQAELDKLQKELQETLRQQPDLRQQLEERYGREDWLRQLQTEPPTNVLAPGARFARHLEAYFVDLRHELQKSLGMDAAVIIPFYGLLLLLLGLLLLLSSFRHAELLGALVVVCALAAVYYDFRENYNLGQVVKAAALTLVQAQPPQADAPWELEAKLTAETQRQVESAWRASFRKWVLLFVAFGLSSLLFWLHARPPVQPGTTAQKPGFWWWIARTSGLLWSLAALAGFISLGLYLWRGDQGGVIEIAYLPLVVGLVLLGLYLLIAAPRFLAGLRIDEAGQALPTWAAVVAGVICLVGAVLGLGEQYLVPYVRNTTLGLGIALAVFCLFFGLAVGPGKLLKYLTGVEEQPAVEGAAKEKSQNRPDAKEKPMGFWLGLLLYLAVPLAAVYWWQPVGLGLALARSGLTLGWALLLGVGLSFLFGCLLRYEALPRANYFLTGKAAPPQPAETLPLPLFRVLSEEYDLQRKQERKQSLDKLTLSQKCQDDYAEREKEYWNTEDAQERARLLDEMHRLDEKLVRNFYEQLHSEKSYRAALCFSGGGIRSATFALGVLQGLAKQGINLGQFHYVSTVSGGGYTGSWLTAWLHRAGLERVQRALPVQSALPNREPEKPALNEPPKPKPPTPAPLNPLNPEPEPLQHLRRYSNPLTPSLGLLSADTWTLVGTYLRNLSLNWAVLLPLLMAFLAAPRFAMAFACWNKPTDAALQWLPVVGLVAGMIAVAYIVANRPSLARQSSTEKFKALQAKVRKDEIGFLWFGLLFLWIAAAASTSFWAWLHIKYKDGAGLVFKASQLSWAGGIVGLAVLIRLVLKSFYAANPRPAGLWARLWLVWPGASRQKWWAWVIMLAGFIWSVGSLRFRWWPVYEKSFDSKEMVIFILFALALYGGGIFLSWLVFDRWDRREFWLSLLPSSLIGGLFLWGAALLFSAPIKIDVAHESQPKAVAQSTTAATNKLLVKPTGAPVQTVLETDEGQQTTTLKLAVPVTTEEQKSVDAQRAHLDAVVAQIKKTALYIVVATPLFLLVFLAAAVLFIGLSSSITTDADREWMARCGAWVLIAGLGWIILSVVVLFGPEWILRANKYAVALVTSASGLTTLILGWLPKTAATLQGSKENKGASTSIIKLVLPLAAVVFALSLAALLALATGRILRFLAEYAWVQKFYANFLPDSDVPLAQMSGLLEVVKQQDQWAQWQSWHWLVLHELSGPVVLFGVVVLLVVGGVLGLFVNVNKFSLHAANRDRLIRAYLGASNPQRRPNLFTGFDPRDDVQMHELHRPLFSAASFKDFSEFCKLLAEPEQSAAQTANSDIEKLRKGVADFIRQQLSPATLERLKQASQAGQPSSQPRVVDEAEQEPLKELVADELNRILHGQLIYTPKPKDRQRSLRERLVAYLFFLDGPGQHVFEVCETIWEGASSYGQKKSAEGREVYAKQPDGPALRLKDYQEKFEKIKEVYEAQPAVPIFPFKWLPRKFGEKKKIPVARVQLNGMLLELAFPDFLDLAEENKEARPLPVLNIALNLVNSKELAWQERKAESFTVSSLHAGSMRLGYRCAKEYAIGFDGQGAITLGTAMAISGAAANPNAGYHSSPLITFFLSFFNVRMGWWLGNPGTAGQQTYRTSSPFFAPNVLLAETFGFTDDKHPYVNASDGGHFDNLAIYEMVRRRVHFIVATDGGQDSGCTFDDLGIAIRLIRADLGVPIEFKGKPKLPISPRVAGGKEPPKDKTKYCAIAEINYKAVDGEQAENGVLLIIKPAVYGDEPADIYNYAQSNSAFPQDPTFTDQWFSESQFESYRHLGEYIIQQITQGLPVDDPNLKTLKQCVCNYLSAEKTEKAEEDCPKAFGN
jgi:hypothetical protein